MRRFPRHHRFRLPAGLRRGLGRWLSRPAALALIVASALLTVNAGTPRAQANFPQGGSSGGGGGSSSSLAGSLFAGEQDLFQNDGRIKLLVLGLNPTGLTESATEQIGLILQKNLRNTGHFDVVGPREVNAAFERSAPDLVDCREIACGVEAGKRIHADFVLVGTLTLDEQTFSLRVRMIDTLNNLTDYQEEIQFRDASMDDDLFQLANNISRNSLLQGRVLSTSIRGIVISLGKVNGIRLGDYMVIYKQEVPITNLEGQQIDTQRKNVAIVKVLNVNQNSSEAILIHKTEEPQVGYFVHTYLDPQRQIELIENTRKELDTGIRLANKIRPLELAPVLVQDTDRQRWVANLRSAEDDRDRWFTVSLVAGAITLYVLDQYDSSKSADKLELVAAGGATGYAFWRWTSARQNINDLMVEGRGKGYVQLDLTPYLTPHEIGVHLAMRF
jgi:hypothetical protein